MSDHKLSTYFLKSEGWSPSITKVGATSPKDFEDMDLPSPRILSHGADGITSMNMDAATVDRWGPSQMSDGRDNVLVIPIIGSMTKYTQIDWDTWSLTASTVRARQMLEYADADRSIVAVILAFDSPGGAVFGTEQLANQVYNMRSTTPVYSYVDSGMMASAAYWVGSQAVKVYASATTDQIGSVGIVTTHVDLSKMQEELGIKVTPLASTGSVDKVVGPSSSPLSDEDRDKITAALDTLRDEFMASVKRGRGDKIKDEARIREAAAPFAREAQKLGLIDGIRTLEQVVAEAAREGRRIKRNSNSTTAESGNNPISSTMNSFFAGLFGNNKSVDPETLSEEDGKEFRAELEKTVEERDNYKAQTSVLSGEKEILAKELEALKAANAELSAKLEASEQQSESKDASLAEKEKAASEYAAKVSQLSESIQAVTQQLADMKANYDALGKQIGKPEEASPEAPEAVADPATPKAKGYVPKGSVRSLLS